MIAGIHIRSAHLKLIASSHVRNSLRNGAGVIFLVLSMLIGLVLATIAVLPVEQFMKVSEREGVGKTAEMLFNEAIGRWGPDVLSAFVGATPEQAKFFLADQPALVSLFLILLFAFLPFLTFLSGFNQTSGDIGSRGLRYLLLRTERSNVYLGRLIGTYVFTLVVITVIMAVVGLYIIVKVKFYGAGDVLVWLARGWFAAAMFMMPWVALSAWISATIPFPFLSLLVTQGGLTFWIILVAIMRGKEAALGHAAYATPWGYKWWLLDPSLGKMLAAVLIMLAFTAILTLLGLRTFHRRDV